LSEKLKVGIIRCQQTEIYCPATTCLANAAKGEGGYAETGPVEVIGVNSCGGCPGKQVYARVMDMKKRGAEKIVLASCILKGTPSYLEFPCPFAAKIKKVVNEKAQMETIDWTH
jgi:predicted metal-binding protein